MSELLNKTMSRCLIVAFTLILGACASNDDEAAPAPLTDFKQEIGLKKLWSVSVGNGQGPGYTRLRMGLDGNELAVVSNDGIVQVININTGKKIMRRKTGLKIIGGVGVGEYLLLVGTEEGDIVAINRSNGRKAWRVSVGSEVLAPPASNGETVVAQTYDGHIVALSAKDGKKLWSYASQVPRLTIRGTSAPLIVGNAVVAGLANGRIVGLDLETGTPLWEHRVGIPQGSTEIERLVDIDGDLLLFNELLYVVGFQGSVTSINLNNGQKLWDRPASSAVGLATGYSNVYVSGEDGEIAAFKMSGESVTWTQSVLSRRNLSAPTVLSRTVVVADFEGYIHLLSQVDGRLVGRVHAGGDGIRAPMISVGNRLFVYTNDGDLIAYRARALTKEGQSLFGRMFDWGEKKQPETVDDAERRRREYLRRNDAEEKGR